MLRVNGAGVQAAKVHQQPSQVTGQSFAISHPSRRNRLPIEFAALPSRPHLLASERFHALFHSLFKVLFNFPSLYLFAIGLVVIFSLRWRLPPTSPCTRKQGDSLVIFNPRRPPGDTGLAPFLAWSLTQENLRQPVARIRTTFTLQLQAPLPALGFSAGLFPFHSQLLWESPLVSFPPLSNMLKFSG